MLIGVPKEIKSHEYRVGLTPAGVRELVALGHQVVVQLDAGAAIGLFNEDYRAAGAEVVDSAEAIFTRAEMIVKVKEPLPAECAMLRCGQIVFTFLHLAADLKQTRALMASNATCIAYETVTDKAGGLPLLAPMSEVAGRMAIQAGAHCLEKMQGGSGILLGGVPGVEAANVLIIGGGVVGLNAARVARGMGARVTIIDSSLARLKYIDDVYGAGFTTLFSTADMIEKQLAISDLVVGAVLIPGAVAPRLVTKAMLKVMKPGSVLVDVAIDQGGCFETSKATTYQAPIYVVDGIIHYCVANMPSGVARTSTFALTNASMPYVIALANKGAVNAMLDNPYLMNGLNVYRGSVTIEPVALALGCQYIEPKTALTQKFV